MNVYRHFKVASRTIPEPRNWLERVDANESVDKLILMLKSVGWTEVYYVGVEYPAHTDVGGYPLFYVMKDGEPMCPKCLNENLGLVLAKDDEQWTVEGCDINYEDEALYCSHCGTKMPSAYGEES